MTNKNLTKALVLALALSVTTSIAASGNSYDSGANTLLFVDKNDATNSYSATVTLGAPGQTAPRPSVTWNCNFSNQEPNLAVFTFQVGGAFTSPPPSGVSDNAGLASSTATVSWQAPGTSTAIDVPVLSILGNYQDAKPTYYQFFINDATFISDYDPADSVILSVDVNFNDTFRAAPDSGGDQATYIDYVASSFSGLALTSNLNKTGAQYCIDEASQQSQPGPGTQIPQAPASAVKYEGPEFTALSLKPVMHGASTALSGKNLDAIRSIEIGGKASTFTAISDTELSLTPAADLAPGTYDLVIQSAAGKLTHINAIRVRPELRSFSITTMSEGQISENQYLEHSLIAGMQQPELNKARCIVNGSDLAQARAQAQRLCAFVMGSNSNIETTVVEARSTVRNSTVYARVIYGWN